MGAIKQTPQKGSPIVELEITYGGTEAPFGGIDTSAPPAYIDPKCFPDASSFMVVDNKLCLTTLQPYTLPVLFTNLSTPILIGAGTAQLDTTPNRNAALQYNYAIGYTITNIVGPPSGKTYTFYLTAWNPRNTAVTYDDNISFTFLDSAISAAAASITLPLVSSGPTVSTGGSGALINITSLASTPYFSNQIAGFSIVHPGTGYVVGGNGYNIIQGSNFSGLLLVDTIDGSGGILTAHVLYGQDGHGYSLGSASLRVANNPTALTLTLTSPGVGTQTYSAVVSYLPAGLTQAQQAIQGMIYAINTGFGGGTAPNPDIYASASADGNSLVLTATVPGASGNNYTVQDVTVNPILSTAPPFYYFPVRTSTYFIDGVDQTTSSAPAVVGPASLTNIGNTLYIGNIGPVILQYSGPGQLSIATMYTGARILKKFAGSLLGLGAIPALNTFLQNPDMIFIWSAGNNPAEFNPLQANGNVTGAGFAQLADISDSLTGMIVSNNTGFILRQQGISYATATSNGTSPFDFANVGLGPSGEGAQIPSLVCQYDQMGCYVGNSNIYGASQSISPIGNKIKSAIFAFLDTIPDPIPSGFSANNLYLMQSNAAALTLGGNTHPYFVFLIGSFLYIYSGINGTWMKLKYIFPIYPEVNSGAFLANFSNTSISTRQEGFKQDKMVAIQSIFNNSGGFTTYRAFSIAEGANLVALQNASLNPTVYFPVEQVAFGRDVTIDSLLIAYDYNTGGDGNSSVTLNFYFNDANQLSTLFATHQVPIGIGLLPIAHNIAQIFPTVAPGIFTAKDPQLFITVGIGGALTSAIIRITKITIFGTYDASQRPV